MMAINNFCIHILSVMLFSKIVTSMSVIENEIFQTSFTKSGNVKYTDHTIKITEGDSLRRYRRQDTTDTTTDTTLAVTGDTTVATDSTTAAGTAAPSGFSPNPGTPGFACSIDLYKRANQKCCMLPELVEKEIIFKCNKIISVEQVYRRIVQSQQKYITLRKILLRNDARPITMPVKNASIALTVEQICLTQCVFRQLRWLNKDNVIDENYLYSYLAIQLPAAWVEKIANARVECNSLLTTDAQAHVLTMSGVKCSLIPAKLLRCIKRHLLINCASVINQEKQCLLDNMKLGTCDINTL